MYGIFFRRFQEDSKPGLLADGIEIKGVDYESIANAYGDYRARGKAQKKSGKTSFINSSLMIALLASVLNGCVASTGQMSVPDLVRNVVYPPQSRPPAAATKPVTPPQDIEIIQSFDYPLMNGWLGRDYRNSRFVFVVNGQKWVMDKIVTHARIVHTAPTERGEVVVVEEQTDYCADSHDLEPGKGVRYRFILAEDNQYDRAGNPRITKYEPSSNCVPLEFSGTGSSWQASQVVPPKPDTLETQRNIWTVENGGFKKKSEKVTVVLESLPEDAPLRMQAQRKSVQRMDMIGKSKQNLPGQVSNTDIDSEQKPIKVKLSDN